MKNIKSFSSENFQFLEVKFSTYLNRLVFVMKKMIDYVTNSVDPDQTPCFAHTSVRTLMVNTVHTLVFCVKMIYNPHSATT